MKSRIRVCQLVGDGQLRNGWTANMRLAFAVLAVLLLAPSEAKKKILSFGGNGMIGSEVVHQMLGDSNSEEYEISVVSRGSLNYDSEVRVMPFVESLICDRNRQPPGCGGADYSEANYSSECNALRLCEDLVQKVASTDRFDAVVDFSGYEPKWVADAADLLKVRRERERERRCIALRKGTVL